MIQSSKFTKNEAVRTIDNEEGVVTEIYVSYPTITQYTDLSAPEFHYQVMLDRGWCIFFEEELCDIRQLLLDLDPIECFNAASDNDYYYNRD